VPVLVDVAPGDGADLASVRAAIRGADAVEHVFTTAESRIVFTARVPDTDVAGWLADVLGGDAVAEQSVTLLSDVDWSPDPGGTEFALDCAECGNTVDSEGVSARIGGERRRFCCPSCEARFRERYDRIEGEAG
jgi:hypothetical protein